MTMLPPATPAQWRAVPEQVADLAVRCMAPAWDTRQILSDYPLTKAACVMYLPEMEQRVLVTTGDPEEAKAPLTALRDKYGEASVDLCPAEMWEDPAGEFVKIAYSPTIRAIGETMNLLPGKFMGVIPNKPGPISSMLTSGLLGAGLGYGAGRLGEALMPETWRRGRLSKTLSVLGGLAGATPGALYGLSNKLTDRPFNDSSILDHPAPNFKDAAEAYGRELTEGTGFEDLPPIDVDQFNQAIWGNPYVSQNMSLPMQGAASSALATAQQLPGGAGPGYVTPLQMARLAAGMGTGYLSGGLVGGALGMLTGLPDTTQDLLKRTGLYAGIVSAAIPALFGNHGGG